MDDGDRLELLGAAFGGEAEQTEAQGHGEGAEDAGDARGRGHGVSTAWGLRCCTGQKAISDEGETC